MKKIYIIPQTEIVKTLMEEHILDESKFNIVGEGGTNGTVDIIGSSDGGEDPDEIFGKDNRNLWDGWDD